MRNIFDQLKPVLDALEQQQREISLFIRDDDVDENEESLRQLLDVAFIWNVPICLAAIPARLTDEAVTLLQNFQSQNPSLIELHQHGWQHLNHETTGRKCEFGLSRSFEQQLEDIECGRQRMNAAFQSNWFPAFTPPWNRCTEATFRALEQTGFTVLSRESGATPASGYRFNEISTTLDLFRWKSGAQLKAPQEVVDELCRQLETQTRIGLLLHHKVMDASAFSLLELLLVTLKRSPAVRFHSFQSLMYQHRPVSALIG